MNNLSWFLYFAEVLPSIGILATAIAVILGVFGSVGMVLWQMAWLDRPAHYPKPMFKTFISVVVTAALLATLIPSKETIYLIAGSEVGEVVVASDEGKAIVSDIHEVIKHQLNSLKGDE